MKPTATKILVTGFEPFLDETVNPTARLVEAIQAGRFGDGGAAKTELRGLLLPVLFDHAFERLEHERKIFRPDVIVSFGLAGGRETIDVEQVALNFRGGGQAARGDNSGARPEGEILPGAPLALASTLPVEALLQHLTAAGIANRRSLSAGSYVCNDLFYQMQNGLRFTSVKSGFIHVPRMAQDVASEAPNAWAWSKFETAFEAILAAFEG